MKTITILLLSAAAASAYSLHEWGTFTTVAGSDGVLLTGLEREEAPLPLFTYSHFGLENGNLPRGQDDIIRRHGGLPFFIMSKGLGRPVKGVTVKMETPVIYFHSDKAFDVSVKVGFNGGTISQWYPDRSGGEILPVPPKPEGLATAPPNASGDTPTPSDADLRKMAAVDWALDFSKPWQGSIEWKARVLSPAESRDAILFKPGESLHWMRPRVAEANAVRTANGETEGFLFYRGIGSFDPGLTTTVGSDDTLHLVNRTGGEIPFAFVFEKQGATTRWTSLKGGLAAGASADVAAGALIPANGAFAEPVYREMIAGLAETGLLRSEAKAMVETWWDSYFAADGLRVFWVLPRAKTDAILPLEVTPAPENSIRVIVGRSEVLRPSREREMLALSRGEEAQQNQWQWLRNQDRFGIAYQRRLETMGQTAAAAR